MGGPHTVPVSFREGGSIRSSKTNPDRRPMPLLAVLTMKKPSKKKGFLRKMFVPLFSAERILSRRGVNSRVMFTTYHPRRGHCPRKGDFIPGGDSLTRNSAVTARVVRWEQANPVCSRCRSGRGWSIKKVGATHTRLPFPTTTSIRAGCSSFTIISKQTG